MFDQFDESKNRQFELMLDPAIERLQKYTPEQLVEKAGCSFDAETGNLVIRSMGQDITFHYPDFETKNDLEMWHHLTLLQYLDTATGAPLSGNRISLTDMPGGLFRGRGYEKHIDIMCVKDLGDVSVDAFKAACMELGARIVPGKADISVEVDYAPRFPVALNFWEADDEYPISIKILVDEFADQYLTIEAAGGACLTVLQEIHDRIKGIKKVKMENLW